MQQEYNTVPASPEHVAALTDIELAAAAMLKGHAPASVLEERTPHDEFLRAQREGRLWVALRGETPVGFAHVEMLAVDLPHLQELDVAPSHGRRGLGTALLHAVLDWVSRTGHTQITLSTFRQVAWNMPFYARCGFVEVRTDEMRAELGAIVRAESDRGLDRNRRVVMTCAVKPQIRLAQPVDLDRLVDIWLNSVRATHHFLTEADIQSLLPLVRDEALPNLGELWVLCDANEVLVGFMGLEQHSLEALFIDPSYFRRGGGRRLVQHARRCRGSLSVSVNEQNPQALAFYRACGFEVVGRSPVDDAGRPFPLLHLREVSEALP